jgi:NDP-sugar pyrophosphorylase family protein
MTCAVGYERRSPGFFNPKMPGGSNPTHTTREAQEMKAVILAGGLGSRLKPFTEIIPKPLLPVGERSVLEIQILSLARHGVTDVFIATNYMADYIEAFLGDGSKYGVNLVYSREDQPLGTCGPIALIEKELDRPFILMNGDILTTLDFRKAYEFALGHVAPLVVVTKEIRTPFSFGNVVSSGDCLIDVDEKPNFRFEVLAGIYILKPEILAMIPKNTYFGIDTLIKNMLAAPEPVGRYLMPEYWLDIGQIEDFKQAREAYTTHFGHLPAKAGSTR